MKAQTATLTKENHTGKIASNRKEDHFTSQFSVMAVNGEGKIINPIQARIYATAGRHYCCIWIAAHPVHLAGGGYAGGYGYHRASAALEAALDDCGVKLDLSINGVGDGAMEDALIAVAKAIGVANPQVFTAHA